MHYLPQMQITYLVIVLIVIVYNVIVPVFIVVEIVFQLVNVKIVRIMKTINQIKNRPFCMFIENVIEIKIFLFKIYYS